MQKRVHGSLQEEAIMPDRMNGAQGRRKEPFSCEVGADEQRDVHQQGMRPDRKRRRARELRLLDGLRVDGIHRGKDGSTRVIPTCKSDRERPDARIDVD